MRILDITLKDLTQILRDLRSLLFLVAMPVVFTLFMGFAYNSGGTEDQTDNRPVLGWTSNDPNGLISQQIYTLLSQSETLKLVDLTSGTAEESVRAGEVSGALIIPAGFSDQLIGMENSSQTGAPTPQLALLADVNSPQGQALYQALKTVLTRSMSAAEIASLAVDMSGEQGDPASFEQAFNAAIQGWAQTDSASLVKLELAVRETEQDWYGDNPYNQASPGILVQFAIFGLVTSGQIMVQERKYRTLQRMMTTSLPPWQVVAGHTLAMFVLVFMQEALLVVFGQLALGVDYARAPLGVTLVSGTLGLWIAALGLLIGVLAEEDSQVVLYSLIAMFIFSALGGTWFPLEATSGAFSKISKIMPSAWAMQGYQNILLRGLGSASAWLPAAVLMAYAVIFFGVAVWRYRKLKI